METPIVETGRLRLRGWRREDFDPFAALRGSAEDQVYTGGAVARERAWTEFCAKAGEWTVQGLGVFIVGERDTDRAVGYAGLWYPLHIEEPELCWSLVSRKYGKGLRHRGRLGGA